MSATESIDRIIYVCVQRRIIITVLLLIVCACARVPYQSSTFELTDETTNATSVSNNDLLQLITNRKIQLSVYDINIGDV